jgi:hypothetical protein
VLYKTEQYVNENVMQNIETASHYTGEWSTMLCSDLFSADFILFAYPFNPPAIWRFFVTIGLLIYRELVD